MSSATATALPLTGIKVVDLSRVLAGPLAAQVLGDLGADVIKVEHPERGDDTRDWGIAIAPGDTSYFYSFNRNKRSITHRPRHAGRAGRSAHDLRQRRRRAGKF